MKSVNIQIEHVAHGVAHYYSSNADLTPSLLIRGTDHERLRVAQGNLSHEAQIQKFLFLSTTRGTLAAGLRRATGEAG
jgi:hypothetical protein